jgi:hypothetical protein
MTWEWLALVGLAVVALLLLVALAALRRATGRRIEAAEAEAAALRQRLDRLEQERQQPPAQARAEPPPVRVEQEYRITEVGHEGDPVRLERAVFADHVLRESVIRLGSLAHGVRRALDAETRNRIRFEMRREVKRARKQRRAEQREAYREWQARQRGTLTDDDLRESA